MTIPLHTVTGKELPELVWHHDEPHDAEQVVARFRPPLFDGWRSKPDGGLWAAVLRDHAGPFMSEWGSYSKDIGLKEAARYCSRVTPTPDARFVVIDSQADAVAVAQAFPGVLGESTIGKMMVAQGLDPGPLATRPEEVPPSMADLEAEGVSRHIREAMEQVYGERNAPVVDFTLLAQHQYAGVYLTDRGRMETKYMHSSGGVPSLWGWDVETVWFRAPELRVHDTLRWEPV